MIFPFLSVDPPTVESFHLYGKGLVGIPVVEHSADNAGSSIRIMLGKSERIGREILGERDFTRAVRVLFPFLQPFEAFLKRLVADGFGILSCFFKMFIA